MECAFHCDVSVVDVATKKRCIPESKMVIALLGIIENSICISIVFILCAHEQNSSEMLWLSNGLNHMSTHPDFSNRQGHSFA